MSPRAPLNPFRLLGRSKIRLGGFWNVIMAMLVFFGITGLGVMAYMLVLDWDFMDALYMVVITMGTVGFGEVHPLDTAGRIITMALILAGVGTFTYLFSALTQFFLEGKLHSILGRRGLQRSIDKLSNHVIVCGYGRIGRVVAEEFANEDVQFVVVEKEEPVIEELIAKGVLFVPGDATDDETLIKAGLPRARAILAALTQESANVYVTLTARQLRPDINIVARTETAKNITRLERAGANHVLIPHLYGGVRMAQSVLRPTVTSFVELALRGGGIDLQMEELKVTDGSEIDGKALVDSGIRSRFDCIIIAIKKPDGRMIFNPKSHEVLSGGDTMVLVGNRADLAELDALL